MQKYGNSWKKVQSYVGTRSCIQIRSHCQKHFDSLRLKAIEDSKKETDKKLFAVYRTYRNTIFDFKTMNKVDYDVKQQTKESEKTNTVEELYFNNEEDVGLLDFSEPVQIHGLPSLQSTKPELFDLNQNVERSNEVLSPSPGNTFQDAIFLGDDFDEFSLGVKRKISWHDDELESFKPTMMTKVRYDI